jgi:hypothetical protein
MPAIYYGDNGKRRKKMSEPQKEFQDECDKKKEKLDTTPDLPNLEFYTKIWFDCRDHILKLVGNPELSIDDTDESVMALEEYYRTLQEAGRKDKASEDLKVPFRFMLYLVVQGARIVTLTGGQKKKAEDAWSSEYTLLVERVRRTRQYGWWARFIKCSARAAAKNPKLTPETCDIIVEKWKFIEAGGDKKTNYQPPNARDESEDPDVPMDDTPPRHDTPPMSDADRTLAKEALKAKRQKLFEEQGIKASVMNANGITQFGKVIGVQRIGRGHRIALNAGCDKFPILTIMNPSALGGMVREWEERFKWPTCDAKARGREKLHSIQAFVEVPESETKKAKDAVKRENGGDVRRPTTYFWVRWKPDVDDEDGSWPSGPEYTLTSRSSMIAARLTSDQKLTNEDIPVLKRLAISRKEMIQEAIALDMHPDTDDDLTEASRLEMPWLMFPNALKNS